LVENCDFYAEPVFKAETFAMIDTCGKTRIIVLAAHEKN